MTYGVSAVTAISGASISPGNVTIAAPGSLNVSTINGVGFGLAVTTVTTFTSSVTVSGSTLTVTGTGVQCFSADNPTLVVDCRDHRVGIGTARPATKLHMSSGTLTIDGNAGASIAASGSIVSSTTIGINTDGQTISDPAGMIHIRSATGDFRETYPGIVDVDILVDSGGYQEIGIGAIGVKLFTATGTQVYRCTAATGGGSTVITNTICYGSCVAPCTASTATGVYLP